MVLSGSNSALWSDMVDMKRLKGLFIAVLSLCIPVSICAQDAEMYGAIVNVRETASSAVASTPSEPAAGFNGYAAYDIPSGSFFRTMTPEWNIYLSSYIYTTALQDLTWTNMSMMDSVRWAMKDNVAWCFTGYDDNLDAMTDDEGNLTYQLFGYSPVPEISIYADDDTKHEKPLDSFRFNSDESCYWMAGMSSYDYIGNANPSPGVYLKYSGGGSYTANEDFIRIANENGRMAWRNSGRKCVGFAEYYNAPQDIAFVKSAYICMALDDAGPYFSTSTPLEGGKLHLEIVRIEDGAIGQTVAEAYASDDDVTLYEGRFATVSFDFSEEDYLFGDIPAPVVMDSSSDYLIVITGFEKLSSSWTCAFSDADFTQPGNAYALLEDGTFSTIGYPDNPNIPANNLHISLEAVIPVAEFAAPSSPVVIPEEGGSGIVTYQDGSQFSAIFLCTLTAASEWTVVSRPDWIRSVRFDDSALDDGLLAISVGGSPLVGNDKGRAGTIVLEVYGKIVEIPVVQGNVTSAIESLILEKDGGIIYDLSGKIIDLQESGHIYIESGRKILF